MNFKYNIPKLIQFEHEYSVGLLGFYRVRLHKSFLTKYELWEENSNLLMMNSINKIILHLCNHILLYCCSNKLLAKF